MTEALFHWNQCLLKMSYQELIEGKILPPSLFARSRSSVEMNKLGLTTSVARPLARSSNSCSAIVLRYDPRRSTTESYYCLMSYRVTASSPTPIKIRTKGGGEKKQQLWW